MKKSFLSSVLLYVFVSAFAVSTVSCSSPDPDAYRAEPQSEINIRRFKTMFDSIPHNQQAKVRKAVAAYAEVLDALLDSSEYYREMAQARISEIKSRPVGSVDDEMKRCRLLYDEYKSICFDSLFKYSHKFNELARRGDADIKAEAAVKLSDMYVQGGYFREADRAIYGFDSSECSDSMKIDVDMARFRLEFENGFFFAWRLYQPNQAGENMARIYERIFPLLEDDSYDLYKMKMLIGFSNLEYRKAENYANIILAKLSPDDREHTKVLGNIGFLKMGYGDFAGAMEYMVEEAKRAIREGSCNYSSIRKIAELMYVVGDLDRASRYIGIALDNAAEFNSKYRIIESSKGYPMINRQLREKIESDYHTIKNFTVFVVAVLFLLAGSIIYILSQRRKVNAQSAEIKERNRELETKNTEIEGYTKSLEEVHRLTSVLVANMMSGAASRRQSAEQLLKKLSLKIKASQYEGLEALVEQYTLGMADTYLEVDEILLAFFPQFASQFNLLLKEESRVEVAEGKLTTEMRIFALWRIGVKKNEDIANCLRYSLNTVKSYKTRVLNSARYDKDEFYRRLMEIAIS